MSTISLPSEKDCQKNPPRPVNKDKYEYDLKKPIQWKNKGSWIPWEWKGEPVEGGLTLEGLGLTKTNSKKSKLALANRLSTQFGSQDWYPARSWACVVISTVIGAKDGRTCPNTVSEIYKALKNIITGKNTSNDNLEKTIQDKSFAYQRLAGPNPSMLSKIEWSNKDPLFKDIKQDKTTYYVADYKALAVLVDNNHTADGNDQTQRYAYYPRALFQVNSNTKQLEPIAIEIRRKEHKDQETGSIIITPDVSNKNKWEIAKWIVQNADTNYHEIVTHLGRTHLYTEPFAVAAAKCLPKDSHPLSVLLRPHFEGTVNINDLATTNLIDVSDQEHYSKGGVFDTNYAGTMVSNVELMKNEVFNISFDKHTFPTDITDRQVGTVTSTKIQGSDIIIPVSHVAPNADLGFDYPYLEDGCKLWNALTDWVCRYVNIYYTDDKAVQGDCELQNWVNTVVTQGNIQGFQEKDKPNNSIETREYLVKALTSIIFNASVQHAAVNFPQKQYGLSQPAGIYHDFFNDNDFDVDKYLPNEKHVKAVMQVLSILSAVHYTTLGTYHDNKSITDTDKKYFDDKGAKPEVYTALCEFKKELAGISQAIKARNEHLDEPYQYSYLLPENIPQSINI